MLCSHQFLLFTSFPCTAHEQQALNNAFALLEVLPPFLRASHTSWPSASKERTCRNLELHLLKHCPSQSVHGGFSAQFCIPGCCLWLGICSCATDKRGTTNIHKCPEVDVIQDRNKTGILGLLEQPFNSNFQCSDNRKAGHGRTMVLRNLLSSQP